jgi:hypothetical protein
MISCELGRRPTAPDLQSARRRLRSRAQPRSVLATGCVLMMVLLPLTLVTLLARPAFADGGGDGSNPGGTSNSTERNIGLDASNGDVYGGIQAEIDNFSPWIDTNSTNWTNDANESILLVNSAGNSWMQLGWLEYGDSQREVYVQDTLGGTVQWTDFWTSGNPSPDGGADPINQYSTFKITYDPTGTGGVHFAFYWTSPDTGYSVLTTTDDNFSPTHAQLESETTSDASQFCGAENTHSYTKDATAYWPAGDSGSWQTFSGTEGYTNKASWMAFSGLGDGYAVWDWRTTW